MKQHYFNDETIIAFHARGGGNRSKLECLGEHMIGDFLDDLFSPCDEDGNEIEGEYKSDNGNGVGLTTADVRTGIGHINFDSYYDCIYTKKLKDISIFESSEAFAMVNNSDSVTREQAILYFIDGTSRELRKSILGELDVDMDDWDEYMED